MTNDMLNVNKSHDRKVLFRGQSKTESGEGIAQGETGFDYGGSGTAPHSSQYTMGIGVPQ